MASKSLSIPVPDPSPALSLHSLHYGHTGSNTYWLMEHIPSSELLLLLLSGYLFPYISRYLPPSLYFRLLLKKLSPLRNCSDHPSDYTLTPSDDLHRVLFYFICGSPARMPTLQEGEFHSVHCFVSKTYNSSG